MLYRLSLVFSIQILLGAMACNPEARPDRDQLRAREIKNGVIGLSPGATEILAGIFPREKILARTKECNYPDWVLGKPAIESFPLDVETVVFLKPDLLFSEPGMIDPELLEKLSTLGIEHYMMEYNSIYDVGNEMLRVGELFPEYKEPAKASYDQYLAALEVQREDEKSDLRVLGMIWPDPIYVFGANTIFTEELEWIGASNVMDSLLSVPFPEISREYLLKLNPDIIIGIDFEEFEDKLVLPYPELGKLKAYQTERIYEVDHDLLTRPSPRIPELLYVLRKQLYE